MSEPIVSVGIHFERDDGGRAAAGFRGDTGDCVVRSIAIALELEYRQVYDELARRNAGAGRPRSARDGVPRSIYQPFLHEHDWFWTPTMSIGSGCQTHLRAAELPAGRLIARLSRHLCAVVDGVVHDTHDPSRGGTRCVYGYYAPSAELRARAHAAGREILERGFSVRFVDYCEDERTPGLLGQIAGVTDWQRREVKIARRNRRFGQIVETLEHEARHVREPDWDCGNRDVLGRGGARPS